MLLGLLGLSAAFDCVDHVILQRRLHSVFGLTDIVLQWIELFLLTVALSPTFVSDDYAP